MQEIFSALDIEPSFELTNQAYLPSCFSVSQLAAAAIGAVGCTLSELVHRVGSSSSLPSVKVDQTLASLWFSQSIHPIGWQMPPPWDAIAGDYPCKDGWIKLHTNLDHHRQAALAVLDCKADRDTVSRQALQWCSNQLESEIVKAGGVAAALRSREQWTAHPQGMAVALEPLITWRDVRPGTIRDCDVSAERPLAGIRVLDLTRVLAGPVSTRTLAGYGAEVLRIDPPGWDEPFVVPDITLGKKCANLELREPDNRDIFEQLLAKADVLVHGYRPNALERLGYGKQARQQISPDLIEVCLDAYGWTGPWAERRGFDSLVQMSSGIADAGMHWANREKPTPLPVQALDHATGYLMAAAAIRAISLAISGQGLRSAHLSLARTAELLIAYPQAMETSFKPGPSEQHFSSKQEMTPWGRANRLAAPLKVEGMPMQWQRPASELGSAKPEWRSLLS